MRRNRAAYIRGFVLLSAHLRLRFPEQFLLARRLDPVAPAVSEESIFHRAGDFSFRPPFLFAVSRPQERQRRLIECWGPKGSIQLPLTQCLAGLYTTPLAYRDLSFGGTSAPPTPLFYAVRRFRLSRRVALLVRVVFPEFSMRDVAERIYTHASPPSATFVLFQLKDANSTLAGLFAPPGSGRHR